MSTQIEYPVIARYVHGGIAEPRRIRVERDEQIGIAVRRLVGAREPYGKDHIEIATREGRVVARLYQDDIDPYLA